MSDRRRPNDDLVEPLFAALDDPDAQAGARRTRSRRLWILIVTLIAIAAIWFVTVGA